MGKASIALRSGLNTPRGYLSPPLAWQGKVTPKETRDPAVHTKLGAAVPGVTVPDF